MSFPAISVSRAYSNLLTSECMKSGSTVVSIHRERGLFIYLLASTSAYFLQKSGKVIVISHATAVKNIIFAEDTALSL